VQFDRGVDFIEYHYSRGVSWIAGISFPEWAIRADVRLCPTYDHSSVKYYSQLHLHCKGNPVYAFPKKSFDLGLYKHFVILLVN
jgi:hypothetical protein